MTELIQLFLLCYIIIGIFVAIVGILSTRAEISEMIERDEKSKAYMKIIEFFLLCSIAWIFILFYRSPKKWIKP